MVKARTVVQLLSGRVVETRWEDADLAEVRTMRDEAMSATEVFNVTVLVIEAWGDRHQDIYIPRSQIEYISVETLAE